MQDKVLCRGKGRNGLASRLRRCADFLFQSDINSSVDDADWADLRGFGFACGKVFLATNDTNFHKFKEQTPFARKRVNMNEVNVHL